MATTQDRSVYQQNTYFDKLNGEVYQVHNKTVKLPRTRVGNVNPDWQTDISNHVNATTPLSGEYTTHMRTYSESYMNASGNEVWLNGQLAGNRSYDPGKSSKSTTLAYQRAATSFRKRLIQAQRQMQGAVFLGELGEAISMIRSPAKALRDALKNSYLDKLKRLKKRNPKTWRKAIPETWLEGCFGWLPFVHDLSDASLAYDELCQKDERFQKIKSFGKDESLSTASAPALTSYAPRVNHMYLEHGFITDVAMAIIRGECKAKAKTTTLDFLRPFGLTPDQFAPTVWELLPWSFLIDYFSNIGDIIELSVSDTAQLAWSNSTLVTEKYHKYSTWHDVARQKSLSGQSYKSSYGNTAFSFWRHRTVSRSIGSDLSIPPLTFELPGRPAQWANMTALFAMANTELHPQNRGRYRLINGVPFLK